MIYFENLSTKDMNIYKLSTYLDSHAVQIKLPTLFDDDLESWQLFFLCRF